MGYFDSLPVALIHMFGFHNSIRVGFVIDLGSTDGLYDKDLCGWVITNLGCVGGVTIYMVGESG